MKSITAKQNEAVFISDHGERWKVAADSRCDAGICAAGSK